ncbi:MAG TPA: hypothetical protein VK961_20060 [Chthoniobacter sp.]|nr:hypothetical protein [Chthoniobacter sp.]
MNLPSFHFFVQRLVLHFRHVLWAAALLVAANAASGASHRHSHEKAPAARASATRLTDEDRQLFAWFDQLGVEDFSHGQLVRVRITASTRGNKYEPDEPRGFLLWQRGTQCRVLLNDLTVVSLDRKDSRSRKDGAPDWHPVSPDAEVTSLLRVLAKSTPALEYEDLHHVYMDRMDLRAQGFVLARFCAARGREDLALRLLRTIGPLWEQQQHLTMDEALQRQIGRALDWRATLASADRAVDRRALAAMFQSIVDHCPKSFLPEEQAATAALLLKMAAEEDAHAKVSAEEFAKLSPEAQARELVFQLRDDYTVELDAWTRPWPSTLPQGNGAVHKLAALGHAAVPLLLEAIEDDRPTRDVVRGLAARARSIRELAVDALDEIAGVRLWELVPRTDTMTESASWRELSSVASEWWKIVQDKGEEAWLCAAVKSGGPGAAACLDALNKRYPKDAAKLTLLAIPKTDDPAARAEMLMRLRDTETPEVNDFLLSEVIGGPTLGNRVAAAYLLNQRHRGEGALAMIDEASKLPQSLQFDPLLLSAAAPNPDTFRVSEDPECGAQLLMFLLFSDSPDAIQALQGLLPKCEAQTRFMILNQCGSRLNTLSAFKNTPASTATLQALETLLASALQDETPLKGTTYYKVKLINMADFAAVQLNHHWPAKYRYSIHSPADVRVRQLAALRAKANVLEPLAEQAESARPSGKHRKRKH